MIRRHSFILTLLLCLLANNATAQTSSHSSTTTTTTSTNGGHTTTSTYTHTSTTTSGTQPTAQTRTVPKAADPIDKLVSQLDANGNGLWTNGVFPTIHLPATASVTELLTQAIRMSGFNNGHIKTWKLLQARAVRFRSPGQTGYSAALIQSDLGNKILLYRYTNATSGWWTRFYPANPS